MSSPRIFQVPPVLFDLITDHSLENGTVGIEENLMQRRKVNNSISKGKFPGRKPDSMKFGTLSLNSTTTQEEFCTMSVNPKPLNLRPDARLKIRVCQIGGESKCR